MKRLNSFYNICLVASILLLSIQSSVDAQSIESKIDSLLNEKYADNSTGGVYFISKNGVPIYKKAFGHSNLELETPMSVDNVFEIGSITKQFTAISIMMLVEQGKIKVSDPVSAFIPEYPNGDIITIHHLLTHTSGIRDFVKVKGLNKIAKEELTAEEMVDFFKNEPMDFQPGEKFEYNNAGYILLGYIIELVTEKSYAEFVSEQIFGRLDMTDSYYASHQTIIPNRAYGYNQKNGELINNRYISFSIPFSSGSLMSTVDDMFKWQEGIKNNVLINEETTSMVFRDYHLNDGSPINYGYGWHIKSLNGSKSYQHGGAIFGFKSMGVYLPEEDIYVIALTNCWCNSPTNITREIARLVAE